MIRCIPKYMGSWIIKRIREFSYEWRKLRYNGGYTLSYQNGYYLCGSKGACYRAGS